MNEGTSYDPAESMPVPTEAEHQDSLEPLDANQESIAQNAADQGSSGERFEQAPDYEPHEGLAEVEPEPGEIVTEISIQLGAPEPAEAEADHNTAKTDPSDQKADSGTVSEQGSNTQPDHRDTPSPNVDPPKQALADMGKQLDSHIDQKTGAEVTTHERGDAVKFNDDPLSARSDHSTEPQTTTNRSEQHQDSKEFAGQDLSKSPVESRFAQAAPYRSVADASATARNIEAQLRPDSGEKSPSGQEVAKNPLDPQPDAQAGSKPGTEIKNEPKHETSAPSEGSKLPVDAKPWSGGIGLYPVVKDDLPKDTFTKFGSSISVDTAIGDGFYKLVPQWRNQEDPHVVCYLAYNTRSERVDFAISPNQLNNFKEHAGALAITAGNFYGFTGHPAAYEVSTAEIPYRLQQGDFGAALRAWGKSWEEAVKDPGWWLNVLSAAGALEGKAAGQATRAAAKGEAKALTGQAAERPIHMPRRVDPEIDKLVESGIVEESSGTSLPTRQPRPARPVTSGQAEAARKSFDRVRNDYARRLGVGPGGQVHHAIELQVLDRYPGAFRASELNDFGNMRGITPELANRRQLHNSKVREIWDRHYRQIDQGITDRGLHTGTQSYNDFVRRSIESARDEIDHSMGQFFSEYRSGLTWQE
jgi:hypothetical protein